MLTADQKQELDNVRKMMSVELTKDMAMGILFMKLMRPITDEEWNDYINPPKIIHPPKIIKQKVKRNIYEEIRHRFTEGRNIEETN